MRISLFLLITIITAQTILPTIATQPEALPKVRGIDFRAVRYVVSETKRDTLLDRAISKQLGEIRNSVRYYYNRVDLNGDGKPEVLTYIVSRHVCGTGGCPTLIFQPNGRNYKFVSQLLVTRQPIIVTDKKTNGWQDLIFLTSGGGTNTNYWLVKFDGRTYPESPYQGKQVPTNSIIKGKAYIHDNISSNPGIALD